MAASTALQVLVSPFLGVVFENLGSLIQKEIGVVLGVNKELKKLSDTLSTIRDVIEDAEVKQIDDKPIYNWLRRLKDLAYEADDILDECAIEALIPGSDVVKNSGCNIQVTSPSDSSCFDFKGIIFRRSIGKRIKKLREKFDEMADQRHKFHLNLVSGNVESRRKEKRETISFLAEPQVYGREEEKEHIAHLLLKGGEAREDVSVCCIVGMGGLGKTTLAQMVYNDGKIADHFEVRCWVCVSEDFELKTLLKSIIESTGGNARDLEDLDPLQRRVQGILSGKKYLLVLDDVWNEDQTKWYKFKSLLTCGGIGSSIIVTTRLESVASMTSTLPIWRPEILSDEDCWSLFKHYAFDAENEKHHPILEEIGKQMMKKCEGVPLAAKALGGLLRFKKTESEWLFVRDNPLWNLPQDKEDAILPSQLKQCFSFCSIFPKDYEIELELIDCNEMLILEDSSSVLFSLVNVMGCLESLKIISCDKIETLPKVLLENLSSTLTELRIEGCKKLVCLPEEMQNLTSLKTFEIEGCSSLKYLPELGSRNNTALTSVSDCLRHLTALEDLVINGTSPELEFLQDDFQDLTSLRHLQISSLPSMICLPEGLQQVAGTLERLELSSCSGLASLPEWMYKFTSLRRLAIDSCENLKVLPEEVLHLTSLKDVSIRDCHPDMHKRYAKETGEDWHKIAHIPDLVSSWDGGGKRRMESARYWRKKQT